MGLKRGRRARKGAAMDVTRGGWRIRLRPWGPDLGPAMALRAARFRDGRDDGDAFDPSWRHLTVEGAGGLAAYARLSVQDAGVMGRGYAAQSYDLSPLAARFARAVEVGRVCLATEAPDLPRLLLGAFAQVTEAEGATLLYGCASFPGTDPAMLSAVSHHAVPWGPRRASPAAVDLPPHGRAALPRLLRLYLAFGASVSDHAVIDRDLGTTHVLAMLPVADIPPGRARLLRAMLAA